MVVVLPTYCFHVLYLDAAHCQCDDGRLFYVVNPVIVKFQA